MWPVPGFDYFFPPQLPSLHFLIRQHGLTSHHYILCYSPLLLANFPLELQCQLFLAKQDIQENSLPVHPAMGFLPVSDWFNTRMLATELMQDPLHEMHHSRQYTIHNSMVRTSYFLDLWCDTYIS